MKRFLSQKFRIPKKDIFRFYISILHKFWKILNNQLINLYLFDIPLSDDLLGELCFYGCYHSCLMFIHVTAGYDVFIKNINLKI